MHIKRLSVLSRNNDENLSSVVDKRYPTTLPPKRHTGPTQEDLVALL